MWMDIAGKILGALQGGVAEVIIPLPIFLGLALAVKRTAIFRNYQKAISESSTNFSLLFVDHLLTLPLLALAMAGLAKLVGEYGLTFADPGVWYRFPALAVVVVAVILGDFVGYWRHRFEHSRFIWPAHAVHHSDTALTWLTVFRFHPINRLTTVMIDGVFLLTLGLPPYAVAANVLVRHYYGAFIHADLPWTFGLFKYVVVSPVLHRWHHVKDFRGSSANYASVFSFFDLVFGTFYLPGACNVALGTTEPTGNGVVAQLLYPLRPSGYFPQREAALQSELPAILEMEPAAPKVPTLSTVPYIS
jgi:sterol desaturase/sphingolipid hydroxylase (fatty acid hydroxylase superfamily)